MSDDKNKLPTVAVIMACYNHGQWVKQAFDSIVAQDYPNKFIVIVDDCSTDDTYQTILSLLGGTDRIDLDDNVHGKYNGVVVYVLKNKTNMKQAHSRNVAIQLAWDKADAFMNLDVDDAYLPWKISKSVEAWLKSPNAIGMVYCDVLIENTQTGTTIHEYREPFNLQRLQEECITSNAPLFTKAALSTVGPYDESLPPCEDWDLAMRIGERFMVIHIPEPLQIYRLTGVNCQDIIPREVWQERWNAIYHKKLQRQQNP